MSQNNIHRQAYRCKECGNVVTKHSNELPFPLYIYIDCENCEVDYSRTHVKNSHA